MKIFYIEINKQAFYHKTNKKVKVGDTLFIPTKYVNKDYKCLFICTKIIKKHNNQYFIMEVVDIEKEIKENK